MTARQHAMKMEYVIVAVPSALRRRGVTAALVTSADTCADWKKKQRSVTAVKDVYGGVPVLECVIMMGEVSLVDSMALL